jgi:hypothetical protein
MFGIPYQAYDPIGAKRAISVSSSDKPIDVQRKRLTHDLAGLENLGLLSFVSEPDFNSARAAADASFCFIPETR